MAKLNDKQKLLAVAGGVLLCCALAGGGIWWVQGMIEEEAAAIEAKKQQIAAAEAKIAKIPGVEKEVIILRENLSEYVKILPEEKNLNVFSKMLNQFQKQSSVGVTSFKPGRPVQGSKAERFSKVTYQYEVTATLWQFMKFVSFIENYERFVSITDITINSGSAKNTRDVETREGDVVHTIKLTIETYVYNTKGGATDVAIPNYKNKRDALREEIFSAMQMISIDDYEHRGSLGRRDIFVDPRQQSGAGAGVQGVPVAEQKSLIERFGGEVALLREMLARAKREDITIFERYSLERALREKLDDTVARVEEIGEKGVISYPPYRLKWSKEVAQPIAELQDRIETIGEAGGPDKQADPYLKQTEFETLIRDMTEDLVAGDLEKATTRYDNVREKVDVPANNERYDLAVRARGLYVRANTAIEFKGLELDIQGVMVNDVGRSGVLLNGQVYEEGDYVSDDLFVKLVGEEQVEFVFRGFSLIKTW